MLDQVAPARALIPGVGYKAANRIKLVIAREDKEPLSGLLSLFVFNLDLLDELLDQVKNAIPCPDLLPKVISGIASIGGRLGRVPGAPELALVERKKACLWPFQMSRNEN